MWSKTGCLNSKMSDYKKHQAFSEEFWFWQACCATSSDAGSRIMRIGRLGACGRIRKSDGSYGFARRGEKSAANGRAHRRTPRLRRLVRHLCRNARRRNRKNHAASLCGAARKHQFCRVARGDGRQIKVVCVADALLQFARENEITHVIFGQSALTRWQIFWKGSVINRFLSEVNEVAVHVMPIEKSASI